EAGFLSVEIDPRPVADQHRRLTPGDYFRQPTALQVSRDELVDRTGGQSVPAAEPVACAADDRHDASWVWSVDARRELDARGDATLVREDVPEVVRNLGTEDIPASVERSARKFRKRSSAEASRRGDPFARQSGILENLERKSHIIGELIGRF